MWWSFIDGRDKVDGSLAPTRESSLSFYLFGVRSYHGYNSIWVRGVCGLQWCRQQTGYIRLHVAVNFMRLAYIATFLSAAGVLFTRVRRRIRKRKGRCLSCGYDMTGNQSGDCPECGVSRPAPALEQ